MEPDPKEVYRSLNRYLSSRPNDPAAREAVENRARELGYESFAALEQAGAPPPPPGLDARMQETVRRVAGSGLAALRGFGQGATAEFGENMLGMVDPGYPARLEQSREEHPVASMVGTLAGSLLPTKYALGLLGGTRLAIPGLSARFGGAGVLDDAARGAAAIADDVAFSAASATPPSRVAALGRSIARSAPGPAALGAVEAGAFAAGAADDPEQNRLTAAIRAMPFGAAVGGVGGALFGASSGGQTATERAMNWNQRTGNRVAENFREHADEVQRIHASPGRGALTRDGVPVNPRTAHMVENFQGGRNAVRELADDEIGKLRGAGNVIDRIEAFPVESFSGQRPSLNVRRFMESDTNAGKVMRDALDASDSGSAKFMPGAGRELTMRDVRDMGDALQTAGDNAATRTARFEYYNAKKELYDRAFNEMPNFGGDDRAAYEYYRIMSESKSAVNTGFKDAGGSLQDWQDAAAQLADIGEGVEASYRAGLVDGLFEDIRKRGQGVVRMNQNDLDKVQWLLRDNPQAYQEVRGAISRAMRGQLSEKQWESFAKYIGFAVFGSSVLPGVIGL